MTRIKQNARNLHSITALAIGAQVVGLALSALLVPLIVVMGGVPTGTIDLIFFSFESAFDPDTVPGLWESLVIMSFHILYLGLWIYGTLQVRTILGRWTEGDLFSDIEIRALKTIALVVLVASVWPDPTTRTIPVDFTGLFAGSLLFLLARVWGEGRALREEVEATI